MNIGTGAVTGGYSSRSRQKKTFFTKYFSACDIDVPKFLGMGWGFMGMDGDGCIWGRVLNRNRE